MNTVATPPDFASQIEHALRLGREGQIEAMDRQLHVAMESSPASPVPHFLLAANHAEAGRTDLAEAAFVACLVRAPGFEIARFQLGLLQLTNGRAATAIATWEPLLALDDGNCLKRFVQGFAEILAGNRLEAEKQIHRGIALNTLHSSLNLDMKAVLLRLATSGLPEVQARAVQDMAATEPANHVLVSAYRQQ